MRIQPEFKVSRVGAIALAMLAFASTPALAQDSSFDDIEALFKREEVPPTPTPVPGQDAARAGTAAKQIQVNDVSELSKLQSFEDVAVIQRRFLPKSKRFEVFLGPALNLNDAFFFSAGGALKVSYYFVERYGVELSGVALSTSTRQSTDDLLKRGVQTSSFISPQGFYGLDFKWVPSYGKMTWANRKITPFDMYVALGFGATPTNLGTSETTFHLGGGQIFALSKGSAVRWDLSWYMYQAQPNTTNAARTLFHNVIFSIGWSWFFPEATYR